jgi:hypothetical protein
VAGNVIALEFYGSGASEKLEEIAARVTNGAGFYVTKKDQDVVDRRFFDEVKAI